MQDLKCWPTSFETIAEGDKTADLRYAGDREFGEGELLLLREWVPGENGGDHYTGQSVVVQITHIEEGGRWGIPEDHVMLSIKLSGSEHEQ